MAMQQPNNGAAWYTASDIQVLEGMEAVRRRPGMYIGSTDQRGLHQLIYEVVDNSVDEFMAGQSNRVSVKIQQDGVVRIDDDGSGTELGLFATTYVMPAARNHGIATRLLDRGEQWMRDHPMSIAATYTDKENRKLQALYIGRGYDMSPMPNDFVKLAKML